MKQFLKGFVFSIGIFPLLFLFQNCSVDRMENAGQFGNGDFSSLATSPGGNSPLSSDIGSSPLTSEPGQVAMTCDQLWEQLRDMYPPNRYRSWRQSTMSSPDAPAMETTRTEEVLESSNQAIRIQNTWTSEFSETSDEIEYFKDSYCDQVDVDYEGEQEVEADYEILEKSNTSITVEAGTFDVEYTKVRLTINNDTYSSTGVTERWVQLSDGTEVQSATTTTADYGFGETESIQSTELIEYR